LGTQHKRASSTNNVSMQFVDAYIDPPRFIVRRNRVKFLFRTLFPKHFISDCSIYLQSG